MIRRLAHIGAGLCLAAIPLALTMTAGADSASSFGWWYQLNDSSLLVAPPPPPDAPSGGIYVQGGAGPGGNATTAYGAVHFSSATGQGVVKLAIESVNPPGAAVVALCPTTSAWLPADGGVWQKRPTYSCDAAKALGEISEDGTTLTFEITPALSSGDGQFDVVIVPDPTAQTVFSMALSAPSADFFTGTTPTTLPPLSEPPPIPSDYDPGDGNTLGGFIPDSGGGSTSSNNFLSGPTATVAPDVTQAPLASGNTGTGNRPIAAQPISSNPSSAERVMAGIALAALAAGLWFIGNRPLGGLTPELVKAGAVSAHGGVGRFARVRTNSPTRVA